MTVPEIELPLAADFEPATRQAWRSLVESVLAKSARGTRIDDPEQALSSTTYDGIAIRPLYTADDLPAGWDAAPAGVAPFRRGATVDGAARAGWDVRQRHVDPDPARLNAAILSDLENGVSSLWLVLGGAGLAVDDLAAALDGVYLDLVPFALQAGAATASAVRSLIELADARGVRSQLRLAAGADPIGSYARTGVEPDLTVIADVARALSDLPSATVAVADGTIYHDAGGSDSDEIAVATAVGVQYLRALTEAGATDIETALQQLEFRFAVTADQFSSIAKLRAARVVWSRVAELSGVAAPTRGQRQHAVTSGAMLTRRDPWVNMLRTTVACFAAAVGGADAITVLPFDGAIGRSDDFARRIARNTQSILHDESSLGRVIDAAGGSFYIESLTDEIADRAWQKFTAIERAGGALAALRSGHIPALLADTRERRQRAVATRTDPITGVSEFAFIEEPPVERQPEPAADRSTGPLPVIRYAEQFEALRDRSDAHLAATGARPKAFLAGIGSPAATGARSSFAANLLQAAGIECVTADGDVAALVEQFRGAGATLACLCSSDKVYAERAAEAATELRKAGADYVYLAGRPDAGHGADVDEYLFVGVDAIQLLTTTLDRLGVGEPSGGADLNGNEVA